MSYTPPSLDTLIKNAPIRSSFSDDTKANQQLAEQLSIITQFVSEKNVSENKKDDLQDQLIGATFFYHEIIGQTIKGYFYNSKSSFYTFIESDLNLTSKNLLSDEEKLIYLNKFHQLLSKNLTELEAKLTPAIVQDLLNKTETILTHLLKSLTKIIAETLNAAPTEASITKHTHDLLDNYQTKKSEQKQSLFSPSAYMRPNKHRIAQAQLAKLVVMMKCTDTTNIGKGKMTRTHRIKTGMLYYLVLSIEKESWFWFSTPGSELYKEVKKILNSIAIENLDKAQKLACLSAFRSFISSDNERKKLEALAHQCFGDDNELTQIDDILNSMGTELHTMIYTLNHSDKRQWRVANVLADTGRICATAPLYGTGYCIGRALSETEAFHSTKESVGHATGTIATALFRSATPRYFHFAMGDFLVSSTLSRAFAKLLQFYGAAMFGMAGAMVGGAAGAMIDITFEYSLKGLVSLCSALLNYNKAHPGLIQDTDIKLIQCLKELPEKLFPEDKKNQIDYAIEMENDESWVVVKSQTHTSARRLSV